MKKAKKSKRVVIKSLKAALKEARAQREAKRVLSFNKGMKSKGKELGKPIKSQSPVEAAKLWMRRYVPWWAPRTYWREYFKTETIFPEHIRKQLYGEATIESQRTRST